MAQMGYFRGLIHFEVIENLTVNCLFCLLSTTFIDQFVKGKFPIEIKILPLRSKLDSTLSQVQELATLLALLLLEPPHKDSQVLSMIWIAGYITTLAETEFTLVVLVWRKDQMKMEKWSLDKPNNSPLPYL